VTYQYEDFVGFSVYFVSNYTLIKFRTTGPRLLSQSTASSNKLHNFYHMQNIQRLCTSAVSGYMQHIGAERSTYNHELKKVNLRIMIVLIVVKKSYG